MSTIMITLSDERLLRLKELAKAAKLAPEDLIQASIEEWLSRPKDDFAQAANYVLQKPRWGLLPPYRDCGYHSSISGSGSGSKFLMCCFCKAANVASWRP